MPTVSDQHGRTITYEILPDTSIAWRIPGVIAGRLAAGSTVEQLLGTAEAVPPAAGTLEIAKQRATARVMAQLEAELAKGEASQNASLALIWLALGALKDNAGTAFASWPAGVRTAWNNLAQPQIDVAGGLYNRLRTARTAIAAAADIAAADAINL